MSNVKIWCVWIAIAIGCGVDEQGKDQCLGPADCLDGYVCDATGTCVPEPEMEEPCVPRQCAANQCEVIEDGCGSTVDCGACPAPNLCGVVMPNQCSTPEECVGETDAVLCAAQGLTQCGSATVVDRCGASRTLACGTCSGTAICGAVSHGLCDEVACTSSGWCRPLNGTLAGSLDVRDLWGDAQRVFAVASDNASAGTVLRFDGTRWITHATGAYEVNTVAGAGSQLWFGSEGGHILSANGGALVAIKTTNRTWHAMHAISATDVWIAGEWGSGSGAYARLSHFDGTTWTDTSLESSAFQSGWYLLGVSAASSSSVWGVGAAVGNGSVTDTAGPLVASYNGIGWTVDRTLPTTRYLRAVWAAAPNDVWAVGDFGTILHFDGNDWTTSTSGVTQHLYAVTGGGGTVWAAGANGTILRRVGTGSWTAQQSGTTRAINAVWARSATEVWAGGQDGLLLRYQP